MTPFSIIDVSGWSFVRTETEGKNINHWLRADHEQHDWLFKEVVTNRTGADWAEKVAAAVGSALGVPVAEVELAERTGIPGVISRDARPGADWERHGGAVLLEERMPGWNSRSATGYTIERVHEVLRSVLPPPSFPSPTGFAGFDVFAGFLVLDALVANQDRHARNWAVMRGPEALDLSLMASFDHGSSLGYRLTDERRHRTLAAPNGVLDWCERGRATTFEAQPTLVSLAVYALDLAGSVVRRFWLDRVASLTDDELRAIVHATPRLSGVASTFVSEVIVTNRRRLLDA